METSVKKVLNGVKCEFYLTADGKYTVRVKNNEEATRKLLAACKTKSVRADKLYFFIKGIAEKIEAGVLGGEQVKNISFEDAPPSNENPIIRLGELVQKIYGENIETEVLSVLGDDHCPLVTVRITLPNGEYETASAGNQKVAKKIAAKKLLDRI
mgnify:CR=1 FL=1